MRDDDREFDDQGMVSAGNENDVDFGNMITIKSPKPWFLGGRSTEPEAHGTRTPLFIAR